MDGMSRPQWPSPWPAPRSGPSGLLAGGSRRFGGNHGGTRSRTDRSGEDRRPARNTPDIPQCQHVHPRYYRRPAQRARAERRVHVLDRGLNEAVAATLARPNWPERTHGERPRARSHTTAHQVTADQAPRAVAAGPPPAVRRVHAGDGLRAGPARPAGRADGQAAVAERRPRRPSVTAHRVSALRVSIHPLTALRVSALRVFALRASVHLLIALRGSPLRAYVHRLTLRACVHRVSVHRLTADRLAASPRRSDAGHRATA